MHAFIPVSTNFASTFWAGHNPQANGGPTFPTPQVLGKIPAPVTSPKHELQVQSVLRRKALSWLISHPLDELRLIPLKLLDLGEGDGQAIYTWIDAQATPKRPVLSRNAQARLVLLGDITFFVLLTAFLASLAVLGSALWRRRALLRGVLAFLAVMAVMYGFVFYGGVRYHAALEPLMLLVAAPLVVRLARMRAQRLS
jgi:hypothetical protein